MACKHVAKDVLSTVVLVREKSGSASLNARISVGQTKVTSLVGTKYEIGCGSRDF
jgi:hypothetical protein